MSKVRRIDWSPDEWMAGTRGLLTQREAAVYMAALMIIYSRGGAAPNDAEFIAGQFKHDGLGKHRQSLAALTGHTRRALARLIEMGKLRLSGDGQWLTNGRADAELSKASERMVGAARAGYVSGHARRARPPGQPPPNPHANPHPRGSLSRNANDLARTAVRIITTKDKNTDLTTSTDAARDPTPEPQAATGRAPTGPDPFAHTKPAPPASPRTAERLAALAAEARRKFLKGET